MAQISLNDDQREIKGSWPKFSLFAQNNNNCFYGGLNLGKFTVAGVLTN